MRAKPCQMCAATFLAQGRARYCSLRCRILGHASPNASGCLEWTGGGGRYGVITVDGKARMAHRIAWQEFVGAIPAGLFVCHHCDNPRCVNHRHMFLGSALDNTRDMLAKGRGRVGMRHSPQTIERLRMARMSQPEINTPEKRRQQSEMMRALHAHPVKGAELRKKLADGRRNWLAADK